MVNYRSILEFTITNVNSLYKEIKINAANIIISQLKIY